MQTSQSDKPLISIIIPSYNQGEFIEQTITSILGQCYENVEIIVMDGGSSDQTTEILKKYSHSIKYWVSEPDQGQAHAINKGFRIAKGDILAWLNSDDMYLPSTFSKIAKIFLEQKEPTLIYGGCLHFYEGQATAFGVMPPDFDAEKLTYNDYIIQPSTFWSRSVWESVGELNESYHYMLDWDWFLRASKVSTFIPVRDYLSIYRLHEKHKSSSGGMKRAEEVLRIIETYADENWIAAYNDVYKNLDQLKNGIGNLVQLKLHCLRAIFYPSLYLKHGHRVDSTFYMF